MALGNLVLYCTLAGAVATDVPMATPASSRGRYDPR
jgi:hypothetical protein